MNNIMIDLETMGTGQNSLVIAIGAVFFDPDTGDLGEEFYTNIDWQSGIDAGLEINADTVKWWLEQNSTAIKAILAPGKQIDTALEYFYLWISANAKSPSYVYPWGNGATFDISLLENAYNKVGERLPWKFWNVRDCRTVEYLAKGLVNKKDISFVGTQHNALDDAKYQATYISQMIQALVN